MAAVNDASPPEGIEDARASIEALRADGGAPAEVDVVLERTTRRISANFGRPLSRTDGEDRSEVSCTISKRLNLSVLYPS